MRRRERWTTPADIAAECSRLWEKGVLLGAARDGSPNFPHRVVLHGPKPAEYASRFDEARAWIRELEAASASQRGFGYSVEFAEVNNRTLGTNRLPVAVSFPNSTDLIRTAGKEHAAVRYARLVTETETRLPELLGWLGKKPLKALDYALDWPRLLTVVEWFRRHPRAGLYLRQVDLPGVDSKFIEERKGIIAELLDEALPELAVDKAHSPGTAFESRYGLRAKPATVRFRLLGAGAGLGGFSDLSVQSAKRPAPCLGAGLGGFSDLSVPMHEFAAWNPPVHTVFITENEVNGLAYPPVAGGLVVFGLGYGVERLAAAVWLEQRKVYYWGDLDTHGFAILHRLREHIPHAQSFLMDLDTLRAHAEFWVTEPTPFTGELQRLHERERAVYDTLRSNQLGDRVRLEQERISFGAVRRALAELT